MESASDWQMESASDWQMESASDRQMESAFGGCQAEGQDARVEEWSNA